MPNHKTRATGAKTKKSFRKAKMAGRSAYANARYRSMSRDGEERSYYDTMSNEDYKRRTTPVKGLSSDYAGAMYMPEKKVTKVTYNKPKKKLQTGRDIPLPKTKF